MKRNEPTRVFRDERVRVPDVYGLYVVEDLSRLDDDERALREWFDWEGRRHDLRRGRVDVERRGRERYECR